MDHILDCLPHQVIGLTPWVDNFMHLGGLVAGLLIGILMHAQRQLLRPPVPPRPNRADACKRAPVTSAVHPRPVDAVPVHPVPTTAPVTSAVHPRPVDAVPVHPVPTTAPRTLMPQASVPATAPHVPATIPATTPAVDASLAAHAAAVAGSALAGSAAPAQWRGSERTLAFIRQLRAEAASSEAFELALSTVATLVQNVLAHPEDARYRTLRLGTHPQAYMRSPRRPSPHRYRTLRLTNAAFHARLGQYLAAVGLLRSLGFKDAFQGGADAGGPPTHLAISEADAGQLAQCLELVEAARQANRQVIDEEHLRDRLSDYCGDYCGNYLRDWARHLRVTIASLRAHRGLSRAQRAIALASGVLLLLVCVVAATVMGDPAVRAFFQRCDVCQLLNCVEVLDWYSCCISSVPGSCALRFEDHNQTILTAQCNVTGTFTSFEASCDVGPRCQWDPDDRASRNLMCERLCRGC